MKKLRDILKPYLAVIFGATMFLIYLNLLMGGGEFTALGVIGITLASFYILYGIFGVLLANKLPEKAKDILDMIVIASFPTFMFLYFLFVLIDVANFAGPTAWVIAIFSLAASIGFAVVFVISRFVGAAILKRLTYLFGMMFLLTLLLELLFSEVGAPNSIDDIPVAYLAMFILYGFMEINALPKMIEGEETGK